MRVMRRAAVALLIVAVAVVAGGPLAVATEGPVANVLFERESVQAKLTSDGALKQARLYTQLTMDGEGSHTVVDPTATQNLRNLEGFGKPTLTDEGAKWRVDLDGQTSMRTVADYVTDLPLEIAATYRLNGESIEPDELVGRSGDLLVTYQVRNISAVPTELRYKDSQGNFTTETVEVPLPLAGTFSSTLGPSFAHVETDTGLVAGDGRGNTKLSWSLIMFEPVGSSEAEFSYSAEVTDAKVPAATVQVVPVRINQTPLASGNAAYTDAADSTFELAQGATTIDRNVVRLATGAGQLLDGLIKLADGAAELNAGLDRAASGSGELSAGLAKADDGGAELATGLVALRDGSGKLSNGLRAARQGGGELAAGLGDLKDGSARLSDGLGSASAGGTKLAGGLEQLADGSDELSAGLSSANTGGRALADGADQVAAGAKSATEGAGELLDGMKQIEAGLVTLDKAMPDAVAGANKLLAGVRELRWALGGPGTEGTVLDGLAQLAGVEPYNTPSTGGLPAAKDGVDLASGGLQKMQSDGLGGLELLRGTQVQVLNSVWDGCKGEPLLAGLCNPIAVLLGYAPLSEGAGYIGLDGPDGQMSTKSVLKSVNDGVDAIEYGLNEQLSPALGKAAAGADKLYAGVTTIAGKVRSYDRDEPGLREGLEALVKGLTEAATGVTQLSAGTQKAVAGQTALRQGLFELAEGAGQVAAGSETLSGGLVQLDDGGQALAAGTGDAASGGAELAEGLGLLSAGGEQLAAGAGAAAAGGGKLADGLSQLDDGGKDLAAGAGKAAAGAGELSSGLGQLNAGGAELSSGLADAATGSGTLADGLVSAKIGGAQVADGATKLSGQGTSVLASSVNDAHATQNRNVAIIRALDERSRAAGMPAGAIEGATSSAVYSFELAGADRVASQNGLRLLLAVLALGALAGLALRRRFPEPPSGGGRAVRVATAAMK